MKYLIERLGDIQGRTYHHSLDEAFSQLRKEYPKPIDLRNGIAQIIADGLNPDETADSIMVYLKKHIDFDDLPPNTPDPEDDRILIWEVQPNGQSKVVWHFSGWHWDADEYGLPQGKLPGDDVSLYQLAGD